MLPPDQIMSLLKYDSLLQELENKTDFETRVQITLRVLQNSLPLNIVSAQKDSEESKVLRNKADNYFIKRKGDNKVLFEVLKMYNKSIARAEKSSTELALAYANRSAILYHLNKLEQCIRDIDRALELSYPDNLKANLLRRKAKCLKLLNKENFNEVCEEARQWLENMTINDQKKEKMETKICYINNKLASKVILNENETSNEETLPNINPHEKISSASDAISLKYTNDFGRHFVTNRDISTGEILIIEKSYVSVLSPDTIYTHCSYCFIRTWDSIPCENCIYAMYCSEKCKTKAWEKYHDVECSVRGYLITLQMNDLASMSLRLAILAVKECGTIRKLRKKVKKIDNCTDFLMKSFSEDGRYHSDEYRPFHSLVTHENNRKPYEILLLSLNAALTLYFVFSLTSVFGEDMDKSISSLCESEDAMFFGKLLIQHYMSMQLNDREFNEVFTKEYIRIGSICGPVISLLNHSCNPNVNRIPLLKDGSVQQVVYALHPIKKDSQIFDDYGCNFAFAPKPDRDRFLNKYHIKCSCMACHENWPVYEDLPSILSIVREKEEKLEVSRAIVRSKRHQRIITDLDINRYKGNKAEILSNLIRSISIVSEATSKPSKEYIEMLELFRQAFVMIHGNAFDL